MTHTVVAVGSGAPFKQIVELLGQWKVAAVPVPAGEGRVVGVVSEAGLLAEEEFRGSADGPSEDDSAHRAKAGAVAARELMSSPAVTVHADAPLAEAARIMARRHVKRLPVVDGVGLLLRMFDTMNAARDLPVRGNIERRSTGPDRRARYERAHLLHVRTNLLGPT